MTTNTSKPPHELFEVGDFVIGDVDEIEHISYGVVIYEPNKKETYNDGSWYIQVYGVYYSDRRPRIRSWYGKRLVKYETYKKQKQME